MDVFISSFCDFGGWAVLSLWVGVVCVCCVMELFQFKWKKVFKKEWTFSTSANPFSCRCLRLGVMFWLIWLVVATLWKCSVGCKKTSLPSSWTHIHTCTFETGVNHVWGQWRRSLPPTVDKVSPRHDSHHVVFFILYLWLQHLRTQRFDVNPLKN